MLGLGTSRFPRVSFKTERPFIIGTVVTFGLITWLHNKLYRNDPDPFIFKDPSAASETAHH